MDIDEMSAPCFRVASQQIFQSCEILTNLKMPVEFFSKIQHEWLTLSQVHPCAHI